MRPKQDVTKGYPKKIGNVIRKAVRQLKREGTISMEDAERIMPTPIKYVKDNWYHLSDGTYGHKPVTFEFAHSHLISHAVKQVFFDSGRKGPEWTITFVVPRCDTEFKYLSNSESHHEVAIGIPKGVDPKVVFNTKVMKIINADDRQVKSVVYTRMRMPTQWNYELPPLVG